MKKPLRRGAGPGARRPGRTNPPQREILVQRLLWQSRLVKVLTKSDNGGQFDKLASGIGVEHRKKRIAR